MPLVLRAVKGSNLTPAEADGNFTYLDGRITTLEGLPLGVGIDSITVSGNQMTITLTDSSIQGPFTIPVAELNFRGEWQASTLYNINDIITWHNSVYQVLATHTSATDFDPGEVIDTATEVYGLWLTLSASTVQTQSGNTWTPTLADAFTYNRFTSGSGCTVTIPDDGTSDFAIGSEIHGRQAGAGQVVIDGENTSVLINPQFGCENITAGEGASFTIKKVAANEWDVIGRMQAITA
jgi:Carbohydrate-binding module family 5/12